MFEKNCAIPVNCLKRRTEPARPERLVTGDDELGLPFETARGQLEMNAVQLLAHGIPLWTRVYRGGRAGLGVTSEELAVLTLHARNDTLTSCRLACDYATIGSGHAYKPGCTCAQMCPLQASAVGI